MAGCCLANKGKQKAKSGMNHTRRMYAAPAQKRITSQGGGSFLDPHPHASCVYDGRPSLTESAFLRWLQDFSPDFPRHTDDNFTT